MKLVFIITAHCNAQCLHCSTSCGPHRRESLPLDSIMALMDEAHGMTDPEPLDFSITGGEPFLDFDKLLGIVRHGRRHGAFMSCVSNASWASSEQKAVQLLQQLTQAGLQQLAISSSAFHQKFVPPSRVERALRRARELGLETLLKFVSKTSDTPAERRIVDQARRIPVDEVQLIPIMPWLSRGAELPDSEYTRDHVLPQGACPAAEISVREDGRVYSCCTPGAHAPLLALGHADTSTLAAIKNRFELGGIQQILRRYGPAYLARKAIEQGHEQRLRARYGSVCDLCAHIAQDPLLAGVAANCARETEGRQIESMLRPPGGRSSTVHEAG